LIGQRAMMFGRGDLHGRHLSFNRHHVLRAVVRDDFTVRGVGGAAMTSLNAIGGATAVALLIYLLIALLKPEKFS
jgi:K+-transporting ATPase KdpF subunit